MIDPENRETSMSGDPTFGGADRPWSPVRLYMDRKLEDKQTGDTEANAVLRGLDDPDGMPPATAVATAVGTLRASRQPQAHNQPETETI